MKKLIIATLLTFSLGVLSSQTKTKNIQTASASAPKFVLYSELKNLASAD